MIIYKFFDSTHKHTPKKRICHFVSYVLCALVSVKYLSWTCHLMVMAVGYGSNMWNVANNYVS